MRVVAVTFWRSVNGSPMLPATPIATPLERLPAVPPFSSGEQVPLTSTPAAAAVSSGGRHYLAKVRVAASSPVVRSKVLVGAHAAARRQSGEHHLEEVMLRLDGGIRASTADGDARNSKLCSFASSSRNFPTGLTS